MFVNFKKVLFFICFFISSIYAETLSVMTLNVENLFDTFDDLKKDDKAFLPIEKKLTDQHINQCKRIRVIDWKNECLYLDWNQEAKNAKLANVAKIILSYKNHGADVIALQEVENINILNELFILLKSYGYIGISLLENTDRRGIDAAFISKYEIRNPKLHKYKTSFKDKTIRARPIFEIDLVFNNKIIKFYNLHLPSNFYPIEVRINSLNVLNELASKHSHPSIALGDFNISSKDDHKFEVYKSQEKNWYVAHREGCKTCKGTYYYSKDKTWSYLDSILVFKDRNIEFNKASISVLRTPLNADILSGKPMSFDPIEKKGVSDHLPMVAELVISY